MLPQVIRSSVGLNKGATARVLELVIERRNNVALISWANLVAATEVTGT